MERWGELTAGERAQATTRVIVVGAEVSGKTTLASDLTAHYGALGGIWSTTRLVAEFGREYRNRKLAAKDPGGAGKGRIDWSADDFAVIASVQTRMEDTAAASGSPLLVADSDAISAALWERRYFGPSSGEALRAVPTLPPRSLYLVTDIVDVDHDLSSSDLEEDRRELMQSWFVQELESRALPWLMVSGSRAERLASSVAAIDALLDGATRG